MHRHPFETMPGVLLNSGQRFVAFDHNLVEKLCVQLFQGDSLRNRLTVNDGIILGLNVVEHLGLDVLPADGTVTGGPVFRKNPFHSLIRHFLHGIVYSIVFSSDFHTHLPHLWAVIKHSSPPSYACKDESRYTPSVTKPARASSSTTRSGRSTASLLE